METTYAFPLQSLTTIPFRVLRSTMPWEGEGTINRECLDRLPGDQSA